VSRTRNLSVTSPILYHYTTAPQPNVMAIFRRGLPPLTGASIAVGRNRDSEPMALSRAVNRSSAKCNTPSCDGPWRVYDSSRCRVLSRISYQGGVSKYQGVLPLSSLPLPSPPAFPCPPFPLLSPPLEVGSPYTSPPLFSLTFHSPHLPLPFPFLPLEVGP